MANSLNLRTVNNVTRIAQGDNASTFVLELLDENKLIMPSLNGYSAEIYLVNSEKEIKYQQSSTVFDSRLEFNINEVIPAGTYSLEVHIVIEGFTYIFPSDFSFKIRVFDSSAIEWR